MVLCNMSFFFFFFNDTATTEIYTLSLHDALPISPRPEALRPSIREIRPPGGELSSRADERSEEHTSELQSQSNLVCRLLLEKKKKKQSSSGILRKSNSTYSIYYTSHITTCI